MEKICFLQGNYFKYYKGGAELQAYFIGKKLIEKSSIHYIFVEPPRDVIVNNIPKIDDGIFLHPMKRYRNKFFGKLFFLNFRELIKLLIKINPDIIYQRGGKPYLGITSKLWKKNNKKLVFGISMDENCSKDRILDLNRNIFSFPSKIIDSFFTFIGIENADLIVAQTKHQQQLLKQNFNKDSIIIPNGLPVPTYLSKKVYPPIICWIANIKPLKKPEIFIKLAENCKDLNAKFVYAGRPSESSYQNMLMKKTRKLSNLKYLGEISFQKTNDLLAKSSLLVNTSITEGFSNTYIQAWMRETPVVTLNCDPDNVIKKQRIGFHSGNFKQLVKDVRYLIQNENERRKIGKKAREYAFVNHDIEKIGDKYFEVFKGLVNK